MPPQPSWKMWANTGVCALVFDGMGRWLYYAFLISRRLLVSPTNDPYLKFGFLLQKENSPPTRFPLSFSLLLFCLRRKDTQALTADMRITQDWFQACFVFVISFAWNTSSKGHSSEASHQPPVFGTIPPSAIIRGTQSKSKTLSGKTLFLSL